MALYTLDELVDGGPECQWCDFTSLLDEELRTHYQQDHAWNTIKVEDRFNGDRVYVIPTTVTSVQVRF